MTTPLLPPTERATDLFGDALLQAGSRGAGTVEIEAIVRARARAFAASVLRRGLMRLEAVGASIRPRIMAAFRAVRHTAPAALLCIALGSGLARADQQDPAIMMLALGEGSFGVVSVPMHVDTRGRPVAVVVHDERGRSSRAGLYVEQLLARGITVLEIEPFPQVTNGVAALPQAGDIEAATLVTAAAETLALAEGMNRRAVGAIGFGAGARAVLLASPGEDGFEAFSARVLPYPGCETLRTTPLRASAR